VPPHHACLNLSGWLATPLAVSQLVFAHLGALTGHGANDEDIHCPPGSKQEPARMRTRTGRQVP
jgi:hypothetical protein